MAPRPSKPSPYALAPKTLVIDNGAYTLKAGLVTTSSSISDSSLPSCTTIPNCLARGAGNRIYIGAQLDDCTDFADMTFRRPVQNGCLVNWEAQKEIWDSSFFSPTSPSPASSSITATSAAANRLFCDPHETNLLLTEAPNSLGNLQRNCDEIVFEEYEFAAYRRVTGVSLNAYNNIARTFGDPFRNSNPIHPAECVLVIDSGYSHTIIAPIYKGRPIQQAVRRLDIGGKVITNYLKEILSTRQLDVRNETYIVNQIKENACFISTDFKADQETVHDVRKMGKIVKDYIMPDFTRRHIGELKEHSPADRKQMNTFNSVRREDGSSEAVLMLGNERFTPPELLFRPSNIGMKEAGLAEVVLQSLEKVPSGLWPAFLANIYLVGGNIKLKGFQERLFTELRSLAPAEIEVRVCSAEDPITATWQGGARFASDHERLKETMITRQDYLEMGNAASHWTERYFSGR